jgi:methylenetetrahydrofolate/methylenetetrahydromethanopterin dehydrogenase (NADP+)
MVDVPKILLQLDTDAHASSFDAVVACDSGVEHLLQYPGVDVQNVVPLVHGAMFTRGGEKLSHTAIFIGGSNVTSSEAVLSKVCKTFFGPVRVSVMFDANGCNTTAAAAVVSAEKHVEFAGATALVIGGTGPVGLRVARLLGSAGCHVRLGSRDKARAQKGVHHVGEHVEHRLLTPVATASESDLAEAIRNVSMVFACGAAGVQLLGKTLLEQTESIKVAVDLNAVPPAGIEGIEVTDKGRERFGCIAYGAIGVGGLKMKIHKAAITKLFDSNDLVLDADEIYALGKTLGD